MKLTALQVAPSLNADAINAMVERTLAAEGSRRWPASPLVASEAVCTALFASGVVRKGPGRLHLRRLISVR